MKTAVSALALVAAATIIWSATVISAHTSANPNAAMVSSSVNVMQMMKAAKNLPEEQFDAF
jgi:hypothetical protein